MRHAVLALLFIAALPLAALEVPPPPTQWVTDAAGVLGGTEEDLLNRKLESFEQSSGAQFIIYTFQSLEGEAIEDFTIRCVERWKVGQKKYDNGLVLFVFVQEKKIRIETGYGLEGTITDAVSSEIIRNVIAPPFQRGDYYAGLNAAADTIIARIKQGEAAVPPLQRRGAGGSGQGQASGINPITIVIIIMVLFFVIMPMFSRRRSGCVGCILPFFPGGSGITFGGGGFSSGGGFGGGFGGGGGGGFSGGGGSFGGGGATGGW